jgi:hypothetical protein
MRSWGTAVHTGALKPDNHQCCSVYMHCLLPHDSCERLGIEYHYFHDMIRINHPDMPVKAESISELLVSEAYSSEHLKQKNIITIAIYIALRLALKHDPPIQYSTK